MNKPQTYFFQAEILSLSLMPQRAESIAQKLEKSRINWNGFVQLASSNLVLPALAYQLRKHDLLNPIPADLQTYLNEVMQLNCERNKKVIAQAHQINGLLQKNKIEGIFMKGTGHMLDHLYADPCERMVYDLDILVGENEMVRAAQILESEGYHTQKPFDPGAMESTMHYPIMLREDQVAGVEIHRMPSQYLYQRNFNTSVVFEEKTQSKGIKGFWLMSMRHRIIHNFLHSQLMHNGHYHGNVSLRDLYDLALLGQSDDLLKLFRDYGHYQKESLSYLRLMHHVFDIPVDSDLQNSGNSLIRRHARVLNMSARQLRRHHRMLLVLQKYVVLPVRVLWNPLARNYVFSRLADPGWYGRHWKAMKRQFGA